jgi:hypothetical protein
MRPGVRLVSSPGKDFCFTKAAGVPSAFVHRVWMFIHHVFAHTHFVLGSTGVTAETKTAFGPPVLICTQSKREDGHFGGVTAQNKWLDLGSGKVMAQLRDIRRVS